MILCDLQIFPPPACGLSFHSLNGIFQRAGILNFDKRPIYHFFFTFWIMLWASYLRDLCITQSHRFSPEEKIFMLFPEVFFLLGSTLIIYNLLWGISAHVLQGMVWICCCCSCILVSNCFSINDWKDYSFLFAPLSKINWPCVCESISGLFSVPLIHLPIFFLFSSIIVYCKILNIAPCVITLLLILYIVICIC